MKTINFPQDFMSRPHSVGVGTQFCYPDFENTRISIVIGDMFYSNGSTTYEMWDFREEDPQGYLTVDEINEHLQNNPL